MADTVVQDIVDVQPEVEMNQTDGSYVTEFQDQSASNGAEAQETVIQDVQTGETETSMETGDQPADVGADTGVPEGDRKLFIGGLNVDTTETTLTTYFETFGEITSLNIKKNPYNGRSKCFGFLEFKDPASLTKVIESGPHTVDGKQIDAKKAMPPELYKEQQLKNMKTCKIFCGGVPTDLEKEKIEEHFKQYGDIREVAIVTEKQTGKRRGFVFVEFMKEESADKATETDFHEVAGISIEVKKATPREMTARPPRGGGGSYGYRGGRGGGGQWGPQYDPYYGGGPYGYYGSPYGYGGYGGYGGGYGGGFGYEYFGGGGGGRGGGGGGRVDDHGSRYGPMKSYGHGSHGGQYHPYSR